MKRGHADSFRDTGYFISLISTQLGMERNDFLRQVIEYEYPNYPWEKDNYSLKPEFVSLVEEVIESIEDW